MRRRLATILLTAGLVAACGGGATPTPVPTDVATPQPTDIFSGESPAPSAETTAAPTKTPKPTPVAGKTYKVKKGDTMWAISIKFGVSLEDLKAANPKVDPRSMRVGTVLVIPQD